MPRKPRELAADGIYHVFNRGNDRRQLFGEPEDYDRFRTDLRRGLGEHGVACYHYCLMPNHFHCLFKIPHSGALPALMHGLQLGYARYFKKTRAFSGHVFQERFRSPRIADESYYLQCGRYIERNPVKADLATAVWAYPYSSARHYALGQPDPLITPNPYYELMGATATERQRRYREFVVLEEPYAPVLDAALAKVA